MPSSTGDAVQTVSVGFPESIDLALLDGAKALYPEILGLVESRPAAGCLVVAPTASALVLDIGDAILPTLRGVDQN